MVLRSTKPKRKSAQPSGWPVLRAQIASQRSILSGLGTCKIQSTLQELRASLSDLNAHPAYARFVWPSPFPKTLRQIARNGLNSVGPLENELAWVCAALLAQASRISEFLDLKYSFDQSLFLGEFTSAEKLLDLIIAQFGQSLWAVESRINLLQARDGYEAQKEFLASISEDNDAPPIVRLLVTWYSWRAEQDVSAAEFRRLLETHIPPTSTQAKVLHLSLGVCPSFSSRDVALFLALTDNLPVIDRFLLTISCFQAALADNALTRQDRGLLAELLAPLALRTQHAPTRRVVVVAGGRIPPSRETIEFLTLLDSYSVSPPLEAIHALRSEIRRSPSADVLHLLLRAEARRGEETQLYFRPGSPASFAHENLADVVCYGDGATESAQRIAKLAMVHSPCGWAASLGHMLARQVTDDRISAPGREHIFLALRADRDTPILSHSFVALGTAHHYLEQTCTNPASPAAAVEAAVLSGSTSKIEDVNLPEERRRRIEALCALRGGKPTEAVQALEDEFEGAASGIAFFECGVTLATALLEAGALPRCARVSARLVVRSRYLGTVLPISRLAEGLVAADDDRRLVDLDPADRLAITIVFDVYSRLVSTDKDPNRADAFKDFLSAAGVTHASELGAQRAAHDPDQLLYFLRAVCVPDVLDQSLAFADTRGVEDERARILLMLNEIYSSAGSSLPSEYMDELRQIRMRRAVREIHRRVGQSKIYVNVEGLRRALDVQLREDWQQYKLLSRNTGMEEHLDVVLAEGPISEAQAAKGVPRNERNVLFTRMMKSIRDAFALSTEYGLDANLSTNVRHGYVRRELRNPLIERALITNRIREGGSYKLNTHWLNQIDVADPAAAKEALSRILTDFSTEVDACINWLNYDLLRIRNEADAPSGLFDFAIADRTFIAIQKQADALSTAEEFLDLSLHFLWELTEVSLERVRFNLRNQVLNRLLHALDTLQADLDGLVECGALSELRRAMTLVRPELNSAIERVVSWFTLAEGGEHADYSLQTAFDAGLSAVRSDFGDLRIESTFVGPDQTMQGFTLPAIVGVFVILLENAAEYCGSSTAVHIEAEAQPSDGCFSLRISNTLDPSKNLEPLRDEIARINSEYGASAVSRFTRVEGRSGYPKIWKLLTHDLQRSNAIEVSLSGDRRFVVDLLLDGKLTA